MLKPVLTTLAAVTAAVVVFAAGYGLSSRPEPHITIQSPAQDTSTIKATVREVLAEEGLTGQALDKKMEAAILAFIKSRAAESPAGAEAPNTAPPPTASVQVKALDPAHEPVAGKPDARYQLIVYSDYECPFCKRFDPTLKKIIETYGDRLAIGMRDFPLSFHGQAAQDEAAAGQCLFKLAGNEAFWQFSHAVFAATGSNGQGLPTGTLDKLLAEAGVDQDTFNDCVADPATRAAIEADQASAAAAGVTGTPTSFVYDTQTGRSAKIVGAQPLSVVTNALDNLLGEPGGAQ